MWLGIPHACCWPFLVHRSLKFKFVVRLGHFYKQLSSNVLPCLQLALFLAILMMHSTPPHSPVNQHIDKSRTRTHSNSLDVPPLPPSIVGISCPSFPIPPQFNNSSSRTIDINKNQQIPNSQGPSTATTATGNTSPSPSPPSPSPSAALTRRNTVSLSSSSTSISTATTKINKSLNTTKSCSSVPLPLLDLSCISSKSVNSSCPPITAARQKIEKIQSTLSAIRPYLYVGSHASLYSSSFTPTTLPYPLTHIITFTTSETPKLQRLQSIEEKPINKLPNCITVSFPIRDDVHQCVEQIFLPITHLIDQARKAQGAIALVCAQGVSRSATCALAYLILREGLTVDQALEDIRKSRPIVAPNRSFLNALTNLQVKTRFGLKLDSISIIRHANSKIGNLNNNNNNSSGNSSASININKRHHQNHHQLKSLYYADEKLKYESTAASILNRPFVALPINQLPKHEFSLDKSVIVIEKRQRLGVIVWFGHQSDREKQLAGQRIGRMIGKQQEADASSFSISNFNPHLTGKVTVVPQHQHEQVDECIRQAVETNTCSMNVNFNNHIT